MRDFYVEIASEVVHHDVCAIIAPDFRHAEPRTWIPSKRCGINKNQTETMKGERRAKRYDIN